MLTMTLKRHYTFNMKLVAACIISFSMVSMFHDTAQASVKHFVAGGLIGAGAVIAWPTIVGAVGSLASGAVAVGAATAGAVAAGGAAVGGAVAGAGAAVGGAVTAGFGAVGGAIAAITASPLFVPALIAVGVITAGYFVYKHFKNKQAATVSQDSPLTNYNPTSTKRISDTPGESTATTQTADKNTSTKTTGTATANKNTAQPSDEAASTSTQLSKNEATTQNAEDAPGKLYQDKYRAAYQNYVRLLESDTSNGSAPEILKAFEELKTAQSEYKQYLSNSKAN